MIRFSLMFFSMMGFLFYIVENVASVFLLSLRARASLRAWTLLTRSIRSILRGGQAAASKGFVFFFRGPLLIQLQA